MTSNHNHEKIKAWTDEMVRREEDTETDSDTSANDLPPKDRFITDGKNPKFDHNKFSMWILEEGDEHFVTTRDDKSVYIYKDGIYVPNGETFIRNKIDEVMEGDFVTSHTKNETIEHIRDRTFADRDVFDAEEHILNLANGLYNLQTRQFMPHTPDHLSLCKSAVKYDPDAKCPNIDTFIQDIVDRDRVQTIYEIGGYALMPHKRIKRGFILFGKPDTGKTQLLKMLTKFVGEKLTSTVTPISLARYPHAGSDLYGKLLNIIDDLGDTPLTETGIMKSVIGDGMITCNQKNKPSFSFTPNVVNVWGCNVLPKVYDPFFGDKFDIISFDNIYGGHKKPDRSLIYKITTNEEMSGFFNKCIQAYYLLIERGEFTGSRNQKGRQNDWLMCSCPIAKFVEEQCDTSNESSLVLKSGFHKRYNQWVKKIGVKPEMKKEIKYYLESLGVYGIKVTKRDDDKYGKYCYLGIDLIPEHMLPRNKTLKRIDPKTTNHSKIFGSGTGGGFSPSDPEKILYVRATKSHGNIVEGTIGEISGSDSKNMATATDPKISVHPKIFGSEHDNIDNKLKLAFTKLSVQKPSSNGWSIGDITEAYPQITTMKIVATILEERGQSLGIRHSSNGMWVI